MIKKYNEFIKESFNIRGKGPVNDDLIPSAPKKQTLNRSNQTVDFLRIGKHIKTKNIDGFIDSIQNNKILIYDRISGVIKTYGMKELFKEISRYKNVDDEISLKGFTGTPEWAKRQNIYENKFNQYDSKDDDPENIDDEINIRIRGTEDNPDGLPNESLIREMPDEIKESYKEFDYAIEEEEDEDVYYDDISNFKDDILNNKYLGIDDIEKDIEYDDDDYDYDKYKKMALLYGTEDNPI